MWAGGYLKGLLLSSVSEYHGGMTTNNTINISFYDADTANVAASYFQFECGWVTFKNAEHQAVAAYPAARVSSIKVEA